MMVEERDDMIGFMATRSGGGPEAEVDGDNHCHRHQHRGKEEVIVYDNAVGFGFDSHLVAGASKLWMYSMNPLNRSHEAFCTKGVALEARW
ncbi:hypothetical protein ACFX2J_022825 [Malus domestica]